MAQYTEIRLTDDITGADIPRGKGETVTFSLDGQSYEIDLNNKNAGTLRSTLQPYIESGRRITNNGRRQPGRGSSKPKGATTTTTTTVEPDAKTVKAWARSNGYTVAERGRVSREVKAAFMEAQSSNS